jgi:hypothetical protein
MVIRKGLSACDPDIIDDVMKGKMPRKWEEAACFVCLSELTSYILFLCEKRKYLVERLANPIATSVNVRMIDNVRGLFAAHLHDAAVRTGRDAGSIYHDFAPGAEAKTDDVVLTSLWLMNGAWARGKLTMAKGAGARIFVEMPPIVCRLTDQAPAYTDNVFICPLYKCVFLKDRISPALMTMHDGETDNFVLNVLLPTDFSDRTWLLNNVGLYTQVPANLL